MIERLHYEQARLLIRPGDALLTAEPGLSAGIRLLTGEDYSHIACGVEGWPDDSGKLRAYMAEAHAGKGIQPVLARRWIAERHGRVTWIQANLTDGQRARFNAAAGEWFGAPYEDARGFILEGLGLASDDERAGDHDKICSALYSALWRAATGERIPGRHWLRFMRWLPEDPEHPFVPTPGTVGRFLLAGGGRATDIIRPSQAMA